MKKTTKGAIAAGAAAVLLAGGAGSFAAWNASTNGGAAQTVTAGSLAVEQVGTGTWAWEGGVAGSFDPAIDKIVPGDVVTYTANYDIDLVGTNINATLTPALTGVTGSLVDKNQLTVAPADSTVKTFTEGMNQAATYVTKITFNQGALGDNTGQEQTASLAGGAVTLEQTTS